jgi:hypothetical protein
MQIARNNSSERSSTFVEIYGQRLDTRLTCLLLPPAPPFLPSYSLPFTHLLSHLQPLSTDDKSNSLCRTFSLITNKIITNAFELSPKRLKHFKTPQQFRNQLANVTIRLSCYFAIYHNYCLISVSSQSDRILTLLSHSLSHSLSPLSFSLALHFNQMPFIYFFPFQLLL